MLGKQGVTRSPTRQFGVVECQGWSSSDVGVGGDQQVETHELFKFSFHASQCSSCDDVGGGELFLGA